MDIVVKVSRNKKGGKGGKKPGMAAKRKRAIYKAEHRYERNKRRKAHKEEVKKAKLERKRARRKAQASKVDA